MRASSVIIVSSGKSQNLATDKLDRLIRSVIELKKNPILVLGPDGDEILRHCELVEKCELVFDPNYKGSIFSGIKAGLHVTRGATLVVPLSENLCEEEFQKTAARLESEFRADENISKFDVVEALTQNADASDASETILLITPKGSTSLIKKDSTIDWKNSQEIAVLPLTLA